ncbi:MAG: DNA-processing protein DprA [Spirochaetia bacterium]|nr:DNA-processing protein DprA [Spirochaetia bacterium]
MRGYNLVPLFVSNLKGFNRKEKIKHLQWMAESVDFKSAGKSDLPGIALSFFALSRTELQKNCDEVNAIAEKCRNHGIDIISIYDTSYPALLKEIYDPPIILYVRGALPDPDSFNISVVGTRHATGRALRASFETGFYLSSAGINVVSGLAMGIDAEAHRGSIKSGGKTTAVLGCGPEMVYPVCNKRVAEGILQQGGALLSEYPPGTEPLKYHFPERNRIISGLSAGTVIIEAPVKSGALITADYALEHNRDIFIHSAGLFTQYGRGGKMLSDDGAMVFDEPCFITDYYGFESEADYKPDNKYFDSPGIVEDEINDLIVNYKGLLYRRTING